MTDATLELVLADRRDVWRPGETIRGEVRAWSGLPRSLRSVEVQLAWFTEGRGDEDVGVGAAQVLSEEVVLEGSRSFPFALVVPVGPWSHDGVLVKVRWHVQAIAQPQKGKELAATERFTLLPEGRDVPSVTST